MLVFEKSVFYGGQVPFKEGSFANLSFFKESYAERIKESSFSEPCILNDSSGESNRILTP